MKDFSYFKLATVVILTATVVFGICCLGVNHALDPANPDWTNPQGNSTVVQGDSNYTLVVPACRFSIITRFNDMWCQIDSNNTNGWFEGVDGFPFYYGYRAYEDTDPNTWYYHIPIPENWTLSNHTVYIGYINLGGMIDPFLCWNLISEPADVEPVNPLPDGNNSTNDTNDTTNDTNISIVDSVGAAGSATDDFLEPFETLPVTGTDAMLFGALACLAVLFYVRRN
ncbi:MAG: hypothetical protein CfClM3_0890 [Methanobrevibacter sp. CfCl-M3]